MRLRNLSAFLFALLLFAIPARAQLGPKDAAGLAPTELDRVKVGQPAPDFTLEDADGRPVTLSDFRGKKSVVLVFYRGYW
jgi:cytochrome oxidase Cu insertion factor (SCO1/SenC/PrrC family)